MYDFILLRRAANLANHLHRGQMRKYLASPYIVHPMRVASRTLMRSEATPELVAAAWLHDVLEDCDITPDGLRGEMPEAVVDLVVELTNISKLTHPKESRRERKRLDRERLAGISPGAKIIKLIDRIDNLGDAPSLEPQFRSLYAAESVLLAETLADGPPDLLEELYGAIEALGYDRNHKDKRA